MSTLQRYQKAGGFLQLLNVVETSSASKREKFVAMIREEDPRWADALEKKMLTIAKILSWNDVILLELMTRIQEPLLAAALHGIEEPQRSRLFNVIPSVQRKRVMDHYENKTPTAGEIATVLERVISEIRKITHEGPVKMEKIDPEMVVPDNIEEMLRKGDLPPAAVAALHESLQNPHAHPPSPKHEEARVINMPSPSGNSEEIINLRRQITMLTNENQYLKQEVTKLTAKLDQVRKAAA